MPKMKTHKGTRARFRLSGGGKVMRMYGRRNNFRRKKRKPVTVMFGRTVPVEGAYSQKVKTLLAGQE